MLGVTQIYSSRQAHEDRGGSTGYAGWATAYPVIWPSFFFLEHAGDNILSQKVTQSELDASPAVGNDSLPDPIPSTAAPPHPLNQGQHILPCTRAPHRR